MKHILVKRPDGKVTLVRSKVETGSETELTEHEQIINELHSKVENLHLQLVSNRRELLIAYEKWGNTNIDGTDKIYIDTFLEQYKNNL